MATGQPVPSSMVRARRAAVVVVCTVAFCLFVINQQPGENADLAAANMAIRPHSQMIMKNKQQLLDNSGKGDAVDWAEEEAENKLIAGLELKIRSKIIGEKTVEAQPLVMVNRSDVEAELMKKLDDQKFKALVSKITKEMSSVNKDLDMIGVLREKQNDLERAIGSVTEDINSDETKDLFERIAEEVPAVEDTVNASLCNSTNVTLDGLNCSEPEGETPTADPEPEALAAIPLHHGLETARAERRPNIHTKAGAVPRGMLMQDVARVMQDEEHRVKQLDKSLDELQAARKRIQH